MPRAPRRAVRSFLYASYFVAAAACTDAGPGATPAPDRAEPAASTSAPPTVASLALSASAPAPTASAVAAVVDVVPADLSRGVQIDETLAPKGVLKEGEADRILKIGEAPKVILLSTGAEPRAQLSYVLVPKSKQRSTMKMDMTMKMTMAGAPTGLPDAMQLPQIQMGIDLETGDTKGLRGEVQVVATVAEVKLNAKGAQQEQIATAMKAQMGAMKGLTIRSTIDEKGRSRDVKLDVPANAPPEAAQMMDQMKQSMEQMVAPLPDGEVGEGAQWQVVTRVNSGADILQWTTYTLKKRDGTKIHLDGQVKQVAATSKLSGGQLPQGVSADIQAFRSSGSGLTILDLASLAPERGTGDVTSSLSIAAGARSMTVDSSVKVTFSGKK